MTNELEKQFFDTFGIEPKHGVELTIDPTTDDNVMNEHKVCYGYPQISDSILLGLICILTKHFDYADQNWLTKCNDIKELKVSVLRLLLLCSTSTIEKYKHQVRTLFEEG